MKITLIREGKVPADKRVAFSPQQCKQIQEDSQNQLSISIEPSEFRCYTDQEYKDHGIECSASLGQSDILIGIKEVPIDSLIPDKTYFFFSHTIKKQAHNRKLLQAILAKNITLIDYECLVNERGERVTAFGKYAGIVGAYNAIWTYGKKYKCFDLRRAKDCFDLADMETEYAKVNLPPIKIVLTGGGRVAGGAMGVLDRMGIAKVSPTELLEQNFDHPVYAALSSADYHERKDGGDFSKQDFYKDPTAFKSTFMHFAAVADMLIACAYWDPKAPRLFEKAAVGNIDFKIRVIADVTCDIDGSIPTTHRASTILDPVYDIETISLEEKSAFSDEDHISVMAIDNLPCELPRDASLSFGKQLMTYVIPVIMDAQNPMLQRATIAHAGKLTPPYAYLSDYVNAPA